MKRHPNPTVMVEQIAEDAKALIALLDDAASVQYERSRGSGGRDDDDVARPTENIALDPARLRLRSQVQRSARLLVQTHRDLDRARLGLEAAMEQWRGG